jgi:pimeloyl-ACP methyl ester carboxylesterase
MATINILGVPHTYELTAPTRIPCVLVFIHGWLLSREYWQPLIERLSPKYQCLSYDLRGFGGSTLCPSLKAQTRQNQMKTRSEATTPVELGAAFGPAVSERITSLVSTSGRLPKQQGSRMSATLSEQVITPRYTPATYAQDLEILLEKLNISSAWLVGHSLGGTIALWSAAQLDCSVEGVICVNAGGGIYLKEEFERFRAIGQRILKFRPSWLTYLPLIDFLFSRVNVARPVDLRWGRQRIIDFVKADPEAALGALLDSTTESEVHLLPQVVARLKQPAYFIAGGRDSVMESKYVRHLASFHTLFRMDHNNVIEIPNCGHMAMIEHPVAIANQVQAILDKHLGPNY